MKAPHYIISAVVLLLILGGCHEQQNPSVVVVQQPNDGGMAVLVTVLVGTAAILFVLLIAAIVATVNVHRRLREAQDDLIRVNASRRRADIGWQSRRPPTTAGLVDQHHPQQIEEK